MIEEWYRAKNKKLKAQKHNSKLKVKEHGK